MVSIERVAFCFCRSFICFQTKKNRGSLARNRCFRPKKIPQFPPSTRLGVSHDDKKRTRVFFPVQIFYFKIFNNNNDRNTGSDTNCLVAVAGLFGVMTVREFSRQIDGTSLSCCATII